jgi:putative transposase
MAHTYTSLLYHIIFSTKDRVPLLDAELKARLFPYIGGIVRELDGVALALNGATDHIHLLASLSPSIAPSDFVGKVKANSSGWIRKSFPAQRAFKWQVGYGAFTVSVSQQPKLMKYIAIRKRIIGRFLFKRSILVS